ncbi:Mbov_0400 family ICE element protein [Mycoplasma feriruminatoris]|uniref:Uncharacterized protein n=1 Tax=Mycoplasma feriruminatoris TaxID=1179777 RepID=A0A654IQS1_9MOLU|nr:hypothetical protein [Mycoplasma feriruminatoris]WFQ90574.1 hypothetical protein MFERI11561_00829 [Mycoplasma feriruminatoris]VZS00924.1 hypothetical protein MF5583_00848 [Mycoplasma feriruminatoris]VZS01018.1 hypothetical protein MF5582_00913 [Mycoplasma feriruminatoris]
MNQLLIGIAYKFRNENNKLPISKDYYGKFITTVHSKLHRPHIVIFSNKKAYYLSVKTLKDNKNLKQTLYDTKNLIIKNKNVYSNKLKYPKVGNAINCSAINVMDIELFQSLFEPNRPKNNYQIKPQLYDLIMNTLFLNIMNDNVKFFEIDKFDFEYEKTIWKQEIIAIQNKKICSDIIISYNNIPEQDKSKLLHKPTLFYQLVKEKYLEILE